MRSHHYTAETNWLQNVPYPAGTRISYTSAPCGNQCKFRPDALSRTVSRAVSKTVRTRALSDAVGRLDVPN